MHRHTGLTEEFDDVGITSGDPGDVSLDRYLPAPGGDGRVHDDRSGVHTANGATGLLDPARVGFGGNVALFA